jgi:hypothetical protein
MRRHTRAASSLSIGDDRAGSLAPPGAAPRSRIRERAVLWRAVIPEVLFMSRPLMRLLSQTQIIGLDCFANVPRNMSLPFLDNDCHWRAPLTALCQGCRLKGVINGLIEVANGKERDSPVTGERFMARNGRP